MKSKVHRIVVQVIGVAIGAAAIFFSLRDVSGDSVRQTLSSIKIVWLLPIILTNFVVILFKAMRWKLTMNRVKDVRLSTIYKILTIGFMANNILPARMGEAIRIHLLGKRESISYLTTTGTLIADRVIEGVGFLLMAGLLVFFIDPPGWLVNGLLITLLIVFVIYAFIFLFSRKASENQFLKRFQDGVDSLRRPKILSSCLILSAISWLCQGVFIFMTQQAFGVNLPLWGIMLLLVVVNLAIALPSAPANIGSFEFACILAYSYLGVDKSLGLSLGVAYHFLQVIPVTLAGGILLLSEFIPFWKGAPAVGRGETYWRRTM